MNIRRINKEISDLPQISPTTQIRKYADVFHLAGVINGPVDSPYENGYFHIDIKFPKEYPFKPPKIRFMTPIYHCNISKTGEICLDMLKDQWAPVLSLGQLLNAIISLLQNPNPYDPLSINVADLYKKDKSKHDKIAREYTNKYACNKCIDTCNY